MGVNVAEEPTASIFKAENGKPEDGNDWFL
jgi:hypothetical protein